VNHFEALRAIQLIVAKAMPPDSGATVSGLLGELSGPLAAVGLDPISDIEDVTDKPAGEVVLFPSGDRPKEDGRP
jgi:hypothetical protein